MMPPTPAWDHSNTSPLRSNPERLAWIVIFVSFAIFCLLAVATPLLINNVIRYTTVREEARLEATLGTLLFIPADGNEPLAVTAAREDIGEGSRIYAQDEAVQGTFGLISTENPDQAEVLGSVQVYANTDLRVLRMRRPFFPRSPEPYQVRLRLEAGQVSIFTNSGDLRPLQVEIETPHGLINLAAGSYWIMVGAEHTDVTVRNGSATLVQGANDRLVVGENLSGWMDDSGLARQAVSAEQNLVVDGTFAAGLESWPSYQVAENITPGTVNFDVRQGRSVAYFIRQGDDIFHNEIGIRQIIARDVNVYESLILQLDVNILFQSVSGGGSMVSEFPVRAEINYTSIYGQELTWGYGFYYRDPEGSNPVVPEHLGTKVTQAQWFTYRSPNLFELLEETRPARINSIRIYASGHNYRSMVSEVSLIAQ